MSYQSMTAVSAAESFCRYGQSDLWFRGPHQTPERPFIACIGGEETFGRFVEAPYAARLEERMGKRCLNLGSLFCGVEALCRDMGLRDLANEANLCVLQLPDIAGQNNRFYRVHARRNDRFVAPTQELRSLFPEVDFTEIHFVRHLLKRLHSVSERRFSTVMQELRKGWTQKLGSFLNSITSPVILLWLSVDRNPDSDGNFDAGQIDSAMLDALHPHCANTIRLNVRVAGESNELEDVLFGTLQQPLAEHMLGPATHQKIADTLSSAIQNLE